MNISSVTPVLEPGSAGGRDARALDTSGRRDAPTVPSQKEPTPPPGLIGSNVLVEFSRHEGTGAEVVRFVDKRTGELLTQTPAEQVLDAVTNIMNMIHAQVAR